MVFVGGYNFIAPFCVCVKGVGGDILLFTVLGSRLSKACLCFSLEELGHLAKKPCQAEQKTTGGVLHLTDLWLPVTAFVFWLSSGYFPSAANYISTLDLKLRICVRSTCLDLLLPSQGQAGA